MFLLFQSKKYAVFLLLFLLFKFPVFSQNNKVIDSLNNELLKYKITKNRKEDSIKVRTLLKLSFKNVFQDLPTSKKQVEQALELSKSKKLQKSFIDAVNIKGVYYIISGIQDSARYYFEKALDLSKKKNFRDLETKCLNNLGMYHKNNGNLIKAQKYFIESLKLDEELGRSASKSLSNIGLVYQELKQYEKAIDYHLRAKKIRDKEGDLFGLTVSLNNLAICYKGLKDYENAILNFLDCIEKCKEVGNLDTLYKVYQNLGNTYYLMNQYGKTLEYYKLSMNRDQKFPLSSQEKMILFENISRTYVALGKYKTALKYAKEAKEILNNNKDFAFYAEETYHTLAISNFALGNIEKGIAYNDEYYDLLKENFNSENKKIVNELETKYQTEKKEKELLQTQAEKATTELNLNKQRQVSFGLMGGLVVVLLIGFSLFQRNKRKHQLAIANEKENNLQSIITAEEKERTRIARELHDGVVQQIGAIIINSRNVFIKLGLAEKPESEKLIAQLESSSSELRNISHQMMPRALEEKGLITALKELFETSLRPKEIKHDFEYVNISERLHSKIEVTLYRITQELINNIIKHSGATSVSIQLIKTEQDVVFMLEDDGKGFSKTSKKGIGLQNIKSRIDIVKGSVNFNSEQTGTLTTIKIPL
jgi:signal transduction histidine kinase